MARAWTERHIMELIAKYGGDGGGGGSGNFDFYNYIFENNMTIYPLPAKSGPTDNGRPNFGRDAHSLINCIVGNPIYNTDDQLVGYMYGPTKIYGSSRNVNGIEYVAYTVPESLNLSTVPPTSTVHYYTDAANFAQSWWEGVEKTRAGTVKLYAMGSLNFGTLKTENGKISVNPYANAGYVVQAGLGGAKVLKNYSRDLKNQAFIISDTRLTNFWLEVNIGNS